MSVYLDVPYVTQLKPGFEDPTGCWYASSCMVAYYFEAGPRLGVPDLYSRHIGGGRTGHYATGSGYWKYLRARSDNKSEHDVLAENEGLVPVAKAAGPHNFTLVEIENLLRKFGPLFFYWQKSHSGNTYGHASVIIGVDDKGKDVIYHDPENAPNSRMKVTEFNNVRQQWKYAVMRKEGPERFSGKTTGGSRTVPDLGKLFGG